MFASSFTLIPRQLSNYLCVLITLSYEQTNSERTKISKNIKTRFFSDPTAFLFCLNEVMKWETVKTLN